MTGNAWASADMGTTLLRASEGYRRLGARRLAILAAAAALVVVSLVVDVMTGPAMLSVREVVGAILDGSAVGANGTIVWSLRLPVALMAVVIGASLAIAGAEMQTILNNPLASPFTLGVSAAGSFGAALAMVCGSRLGVFGSPVTVAAAAFVFAVGCSLVVYWVARLKGGSAETVILCGVALMFLFNAGVAFLKYVSPEEQLASIVFWTMGSLQSATWPKLLVVSLALAVSVPLLVVEAWKLTALRMGDSRARSLGIDVQGLRLQTLVLVSGLTAVAVCFTGVIGFIGLVGPHLARTMAGEDQRYFMPLAALAGALLLSAASILSKMLLPGAIIPVGIMTSAFGVPFFAAMILAKRRSHW